MFIKDSVYGQRLVTDAKSPISCFSPNLVYNPYIQDYVLVPCRECAACRYSYAMDLKRRIEDECKAHKFNFFFTLTYDNKHVPMMYAYPSEDGVFFKAYRNNVVMSDSHGIDLPELDFSLEDSWFLEPQHNPFQTGFAFCYKPDIQKFIKRLRINIERNENEVISKQKIRYFVAAEYGPATLRPHYHGLIFCDDEQLARELPRLISKSWTLCSSDRIDVQVVSGAAPQYVAKYVNSFTSLPKVLQTQLTRPFYLCSRQPALGSFKINEQEIFDCFVNSNFERPQVDAKTNEVSFALFPNKVLCRYFRKYCGYGESNIDYELRLYKKYDSGDFQKVIDPETHRYIECHLRGYEYLVFPKSFKYKDYVWYKCVKRLLRGRFTYPIRNEFGYVVDIARDVSFTLRDILVNMRRMYNDYCLYLFNSSLRSEELISSTASCYDRLSFYPYLWKSLPLTCTRTAFFKPSFDGVSLSDLCSSVGVSYDDLYFSHFLRTDIYPLLDSPNFVVKNRNELLVRIQKDDIKKKFNDLYKF